MKAAPLAPQTVTASATGRRWYIESVISDEDDPEWFLVNVVPEEGKDDPSHPDAQELDPDEWADFCAENGISA